MIESLFRRLIVPGFETLLKRRKTFTYWRELEESQWHDRETLEQNQLERLKRLLHYCNNHSPWYRDQWAQHGIDVDSLSSLGDLQNFPIITREMIRDHATEIRCPHPSVRSVSKSTGGSTGTPLRFTIEAEANDRRVAATFRGYTWGGASPGTKQSYLWGVPLQPLSFRQRLKEHAYSRALYRRDMMNSFNLSQSTIETYIRRINRYRPTVIIAYTTPLFLLAKSIQTLGANVHQPQSIIVGAEKLHDFQREQIERSFGAPVFETYGSREFTLIGAECDQHTGLHLTSENLIVEVLDHDGKPTRDGEEGKIVITDLFNTATPFVRYATGDRGIAGFEQCPCGRGLPLLRKVLGRQLDVLDLPNGRRVPGEYFPHLLKDVDSIRQFQVAQLGPNTVRLKLVVADDWNREAENALRDQVLDAVGRSCELKIEQVEQIELTPSGKTRVVIGYNPPNECQRIAG
ncbi:Phenylacetate-coenzyme A ligase [Planctomycetes bacterium CA13]|uniref:Phenylacetate-coenzyme A ligase n=1 Tax=Novipirellula herctigrandis TaxID=2527986 RepID=A0A5C5Z682_9BACT|nr:Phenylacetate-coenzyme A ligase [Planctomycetes bacterium CA13]